MAAHSLTRRPADASHPTLTPIESLARASQEGTDPHQSSPAPSRNNHTSLPEAWMCRLPTSGEMIAIEWQRSVWPRSPSLSRRWAPEPPSPPSVTAARRTQASP